MTLGAAVDISLASFGPTFILDETTAMANTRSAKKMIRKIDRRTAVNRSRVSRMRSFVRKVEEAITSGDKRAALTALKAAEPEIMRSATHNIIHKNTASRKVSRLTRRVQAMAV